MEISQPLASGTIVLPQWIHEKVTIATGREAMYGINNTGFPETKLTWLSYCQGYPTCQQHRLTQGSIPRETKLIIPHLNIMGRLWEQLGRGRNLFSVD